MTTPPAPDPTHPRPVTPPQPIHSLPRVVYSDSHVRLTTETLVLKKFLPLYTRYTPLEEIGSIYPASEAARIGEPGGGRKRVLWGVDWGNRRFLVEFGKGEERRVKSVVLETKGFLGRLGFAVQDPEEFWKVLEEVREARTVGRTVERAE